MSWLPIALLCAFSLATADFLTKRWLANWSHQELLLLRFSVSGLLLVVAGAWCLNLEHERNNGGFDPLAPLRAMGRERGARLMLAVAVIYGITSVGGKAAMQGVPPVTFGAIYFIVIGAVTLVMFGGPHPRRLQKLGSRPLAVLAIAALMAVMVVTHFVALAQVEAAYMITAKRISLLFGMLYGAWWLGEKDLPRNLAAGTLMVAGVGLVLIGA